MGSHSSRVASTKWNFNRLAEATGLSRAEIDQFYLDYLKASGRDGLMDMNEFIELYSSLPIAQSQERNNAKDQAIRIFRAFDLDHNSILAFDEFLNVMVMMNYQMSQNDHIDLLIEENNAFEHEHEHDDNRITMKYGCQIFRRLNAYHGLPVGTEHRCWKEVDRYNRGYVTQEELVNYISKQPIYKHY